MSHYLTADQLAELLAAVEAGEGYAEIAERVGCTKGVVSYHAVRNGLRQRHHDVLAPIVFDAQPWAEDALCAQTDPALFFPTSGNSGALWAKKVCGACEVRPQCLDYALTNDIEDGIWGGLSQSQRRKLARERAA